MHHFHPSFDLSVGFLPVPSPPQGLLCSDAVDGDVGELESDHPVERGDRLIRDGVVDPGRVHSSRRSRAVVSETLLPHSRSASSHEHPVTRRTNCTSKQSRSGARGRWQPKRVVVDAHREERFDRRKDNGIYTSGSSARMTAGDLHLVVWRCGCTRRSFSGPTQRPVDGHPLVPACNTFSRLSPFRAASKSPLRRRPLASQWISAFEHNRRICAELCLGKRRGNDPRVSRPRREGWETVNHGASVVPSDCQRRRMPRTLRVGLALTAVTGLLSTLGVTLGSVPASADAQCPTGPGGSATNIPGDPEVCLLPFALTVTPPFLPSQPATVTYTFRAVPTGPYPFYPATSPYYGTPPASEQYVQLYAPCGTGAGVNAIGVNGSATLNADGSVTGSCQFTESSTGGPYLVDVNLCAADWQPTVGSFIAVAANCIDHIMYVGASVVSASSGGSATTSQGPLSATAIGGNAGDTLVVGDYTSNPTVADLSVGNDQYFDVRTSPGNAFTSVVIKDCNDVTSTTALCGGTIMQTRETGDGSQS